MKQAKQDGFSDKYLGQILEVPEEDIRNARIAHGCGGSMGRRPRKRNEGQLLIITPPINCRRQKSGQRQTRHKIMILGGGPNRIGQGIEFDYCCVHAAMALKEAGF